MAIYIDNVNGFAAPPTNPVARLSKINISPTQTPYVTATPCERLTPIWTWAVGPWRDAEPSYELRNIQARRLVIKLNEPDEASYQLLGDLPEAFYAHELIDDLWIKRDGKKIGRFRHVRSSDNVDSTEYTIDWNCVSYAGLLARRIVDGENKVLVPSTPISLPGIPYASASPEDTLWHLIGYAQGLRVAPPGVASVPAYLVRPTVGGMDLGIVKGVWPDLDAPTISWQFFSEGENILDAVHTVVRGGAFDFWIDYDKKAHIQKKRSLNNQTTLDWGRRISSIRRSFSHDAYANYVRQAGSIEGVAERFQDPNLATAPEGAWQTALGKPAAVDNADPATLQLSLLKAIGQENFNKLNRSLPLDDGSNSGSGNFSYTVTLSPGVWRGPEHLWVGDSVNLIIKRGRLDINQEMRVVQMQVDIDQNNYETINVTLNWPNNPADNLRNFAAGVQQLNRSGRFYIPPVGT